MEKKYRFDKDFISAKILEATKQLQDENIKEDTKMHLEYMIQRLDEYLKGTSSGKETSFDKDFTELENKLKDDTSTEKYNFLIQTSLLLEEIDKTILEEKNYQFIKLSEEKMMDLILDFYESIDNEYYHKAMQIIQCPTSVINLEEGSNIYSNCLIVPELIAPLIHVREKGDYKYGALVHEVQHGIDYLIHRFNIVRIYKELAPLFFETLFYDRLNGINECEGLYCDRVIDQVIMLNRIKQYTEILKRFNKHKQKITKRNIYKILNVKNDIELEKKYKFWMEFDVNEYLCFIFSYFKCLEIRNIYYNDDRKKALEKLKKCVTGENVELDFNNLIRCYNEWVSELKEKQKGYQKTVK